MRLIIGNIITLLASIVMVYSGVLKEKKKILYAQTIQMALFALGDIILGGITGTIINLISIVRNILCYKEKLGLKEKIIITVISIFLSVGFNNLGLIGLLPLASNILYIWLMNIKDVKKFKLLIAVTTLMWLVYDFLIKSYTSSIFDFMDLIANLITIFFIKDSLKKAKK